MKLRNKKTGDIMNGRIELSGYDGCAWKGYSYSLLTELNAEWEDYKTKEPLIKDEKIRKAVRAWAEANSIEGNDKVLIRRFDEYDFVEIEFNYKMSIRFYLTTIDRISELEHRTYYTIAELCGEEEDEE